MRGVAHCFTGSWRVAEKYLAKGLLLSFTGIVTYGLDYDKVLENTPLDKMMLETDCPYLAPGPYKGNRAEPWMVKLVAEKIATVKEIIPQAVIDQTSQNAEKLFGI